MVFCNYQYTIASNIRNTELTIIRQPKKKTLNKKSVVMHKIINQLKEFVLNVVIEFLNEWFIGKHLRKTCEYFNGRKIFRQKNFRELKNSHTYSMWFVFCRIHFPEQRKPTIQNIRSQGIFRLFDSRKLSLSLQSFLFPKYFF